ncbi:MAG: patatin-like phospholipase family protein [Thermoleophilia bacterium]|nr:patatin-like phospholipase family protein [Thermoleophilia bacterium]
MSEVVKLDPVRRAAGARRKKQSKTALVLGGGGFTGAVYEIGALRAFDLLAVNRTVNEFDVYVGTSAGSFVGSAVANGVTPEEMMRVLNKNLPSPLRDIDLGMMLRPNYGGFLTSAALLPLRLLGVSRQLASSLGDVSMMDIAQGLAAGLPKGLYRGAGLEDYVAEMLADPDRTDDFRMLQRELYLTATDLDTTDRIVFGEGEWRDVPISRAVAASSALPLIYEPVEIKGREMVDGGIRSTTNVDLAVEAGARFILVVNPVVPFVNDFSKRVPTISGSRVRRVSDMGFVAIANQAMRMIAHDRLHRAVERWEVEYPGVDILLIEPEFDDELMFGTSIMDYSARLQIAKHGFESVTLRLARDYERYKRITERHGIEISARRIKHVLDQVERERDQAPAWRRVFEQTTSALLRQPGGDSA